MFASWHLYLVAPPRRIFIERGKIPGNYYSLRAEHEKAVKYFRRATQLDRTYLSAWTLMGHEYVEMKNSHAAIEAYRKAVGKSSFGRHYNSVY